MVTHDESSVEGIQDNELLADHRAMQAMESLKAELLASISHELRSPLAVIKGYAATLLRYEERLSGEERHEFLVAINEASNRLEWAITRLLEMSQLSTGNVSLQRSDVDLGYLAREAIIVMQQRCEEHSMFPLQHRGSPHLNTHHPTFHLALKDAQAHATEEALILYADRHLLRELFDNLLENAVLYSSGEGRIDITLCPLSLSDESNQQLLAGRVKEASQQLLRRQQDAQGMYIQIHDDGIGISQAQLERIFERFHRVDTRLTREINGLGLGLAICKRIVELHDGVIWATSEPGQGSTFHVLLPIGESPSAVR